MNKLLYLLFISIFLLDYLSLKLGILSRYVTWVPEILSLAVMVMVIARMAMVHGSALGTKYKLLLVVFLVHIFFGIILNAVPEGAIVYGLRTYLKFIPFFLLPTVYTFSDSEMKKQLKFLLVLLLFQFPVALYQRLIQFGNLRTGDEVRGTVASSSMLSILMYCTIAMLMSLYLNKKIKLQTLVPILIILFIPTAINGTKASFFFLPISLFLPIILFSNKGRLKQLLVVAIISGVAIPTFIGLSDHYQARDYDKGLIDFMTKEGRMQGYLYQGVDADKKFRYMGKVDSYVLAVTVLSEDAWQLAFGVGVGNTNTSYLSSLSGSYAGLASRLGAGVTSISYFLWEIGVLGVLIYFVFIYFIFSDARKLSKKNDFVGIFSLGWVIVSMLIAISMFYQNIFLENAIGYLFWYFCGYVAAARYRYGRREIGESDNGSSAHVGHNTFSLKTFITREGQNMRGERTGGLVRMSKYDIYES